MKFKSKTDSIIFSVICLLLIYVIAKAVMVEITHDEAYTFYNAKKFWLPEVLCTGNTHWINTLAVKCAILLNLEAVWQIRWFSMVSAIVFSFIIYAWIRSEKETHVKVLLLAVLLFNPYIIGYFSIARGYAPGLMFEAWALFLFFLSLKKQNAGTAFFSLILAGLSALANFSFIYFFMAFCVVYFFRFHFTGTIRFWRTWSFYRDTLYALLIAGLVVKAFSFIAHCSNDVVGAGTESFREYFHVFFDGLVNDDVQVPPAVLNFFSYVSFAVILISCLYGLFVSKKVNSIYFYCSAILGIILLTTFVNRYFFGIVFPWYRSAIFLFPLTGACFVYFLNSLKNGGIKRTAANAISGVLIINFVSGMNFNSVFAWHGQTNMKECFSHLERLQAKHVGMSPEIFAGFRNYYQMTWKYSYDFFGEPVNTYRPRGVEKDRHRIGKFDYIILYPPYDMSYYKNNTAVLDAVKLFPENDILILRVKPR